MIAPALVRARWSFPIIERGAAAGGHQGQKASAAMRALRTWKIEIVPRLSKAKGFGVAPKRWIVERIFDWLG